jgi:hypothetical protein
VLRHPHDWNLHSLLRIHCAAAALATSHAIQARLILDCVWQCAEFVARSLASGGHIPLSPTAPQSQYGNFQGYDLLVRSISS